MLRLNSVGKSDNVRYWRRIAAAWISQRIAALLSASQERRRLAEGIDIIPGISLEKTPVIQFVVPVN